MHYYIIDQGRIPVDKFEKMQVQLQGYLTEFKISGEIARVTPLRSIADLVDTASQRGVKTLVACGSDDTFNLMLAALKGRDFTLGFIPLTDDSYLSTILGINNLYTGAKTIAGRRMERMDLARIAGNYFISYLEFGIMSQNLRSLNWWNSFKMLSGAPQQFDIRIDDSYTLSIEALGGLVANTRSTSCNAETIANPTDSLLDLLILEKLSRTEILRYKSDIAAGCLEKAPKTTVIKCKKVEFLQPRAYNLTMLGRVVAKFPAMVEIIPQRLKMIVGKNRTF